MWKAERCWWHFTLEMYLEMSIWLGQHVWAVFQVPPAKSALEQAKALRGKKIIESWRKKFEHVWMAFAKFNDVILSQEICQTSHSLLMLLYDFAVWLFHAFPKQGVIAGIPLHSDSRCAMGCNERVGWLDCLDSFNWVYWHFTSSASWKADITICRNKM